MSAPRKEQALRVIPDIPFDWIVQAFLNDCKARNLSPNTIRIYSNGLRKLQRWTNKRDVEDITTHDLRAFITWLQDKDHQCRQTAAILNLVQRQRERAVLSHSRSGESQWPHC